MIIYQVHGRRFDFVEYCFDTTTKLFMAPEEAEKYLQEIIDEIRLQFNTIREQCAVNYTESTSSRNNQIEHYGAVIEFDMHHAVQRSEWLAIIQSVTSVNRPFDNCLLKRSDINWREITKDTIMSIRTADFTISAIELTDTNNE